MTHLSEFQSPKMKSAILQSLSKLLLPLLVVVFVVISVMELDNVGVYPDELVDAQNAVRILSQQNMRTQIVGFNQLTVMGVNLPIYGIKPYNGAGLSYVLALGFAIFGVGIISLKLITIFLMTVSVILLYEIISVVSNQKLAFIATGFFSLDPYFLHFTRYDHGPLRVIFVLFCLFMFLGVRAIQGYSSEKDKLLWAFVAGFGLYNHIVFILPISAFVITFLLLPEFRRSVVPRHPKLALLIFFVGMTPYLFDLSGLVQGYLQMISDILTNSPVVATGGRAAVFPRGLLTEVITRLQQGVIGRSQQAFLFEFQSYSQNPPYGWSLFTIGGLITCFVLLLSSLIGKGDKVSTYFNRKDWTIILASLGVMILSLTLPLIGSLHHQIYTQVSLVLVSAVLVDRLLLRNRPNTLAFRLWILISVASVALNIGSVAEYVRLIRTKGSVGLFSSSVKDLEYIIGTKYKDRDLMTYGWGLHSYVAIMFGGQRASQIYVDPHQITDRTALFFALDPQGRMLNVKAGEPFTIGEFARQHDMDVDELTLSSSKGGYPAFAVATFKPSQPTPEKVQRLSDQINFVIDRTKSWIAQGHNYKEINNEVAIAEGLIPSEMVAGKDKINTPWLGAMIEGSPDGIGVILLGGVPKEYCAELAFVFPTQVSVYTGYYGMQPMDKKHAADLCATGNIWFVFH